MKKVLILTLVIALAMLIAVPSFAEAGKTLKVAYIPNSMSNESLAYAYREMERMAPDYNIEMTAFDGQYDPQIEVRNFTNCIAQEFDAIITTPSDISAIVPSIMEASEKGIIVGMFSADLNDDFKEFRTFFVGVDDTTAGEAAGEAFKAQFPDGAKVVEIGGQAGTDAQNKRHDGFTAAIEGSNIEVIGYQACNAWSTSEAMSIMEDFITKYGSEIQGVYCHWDNGATGCIEALKNANIEGTYVVAVDGCRAGFDQVKAGTQSVCISQDFSKQAQKILEVVRKVADGEEFEVVNYIPLDVVTPENVDTFAYPEW